MKRRPQQQGLVLASMLIVMVVIATAAVTLLWSTSGTRSASLLALQSARAFYAADAGIQWARLHISQQHDCPASPSLLEDNVIALPDFAVTVECNVDVHIDGGESVRVYYLSAEASSGNALTADAVNRRIDAQLVE